MMQDRIYTIKKLKAEGFTADQAIQIIIADELNYIGEMLNEISNKK